MINFACLAVGDVSPIDVCFEEEGHPGVTSLSAHLSLFSCALTCNLYLLQVG